MPIPGKKYDVIVAGAGVGGFAAAVGAAQAGARVLLFDRQPSAGGTAVYAVTPVLSGWFQGRRGRAAGGRLCDLLERKGRLAWRVNIAVTDEDSLQEAMVEMLASHGVETLYNATLCGVRRDGRRIVAVTVLCCGKLLELQAENFVDATGDAVLTMLSGCRTETPSVREGMTKTLMFKVRGVKNFDKAAVLARFQERLDLFPVAIQTSFMGMPLLDPGEVVLNLTAVAGDASSPEEFSAMHETLFRQIAPIMDFLRREIPGFADAAVSKVAPVVGVRYSRSIVGRRRLEYADLRRGGMTDEPAAFCGSFIGGHDIVRTADKSVSRLAGTSAVPYGALCSADADNLLACGRIVAVEPRVVSAVRLCAGCMATGQAAGIAAALRVPSYEVLRRELDRQNCMFFLEDGAEAAGRP